MRRRSFRGRRSFGRRGRMARGRKMSRVSRPIGRQRIGYRW